MLFILTDCRYASEDYGAILGVRMNWSFFQQYGTVLYGAHVLTGIRPIILERATAKSHTTI